MTPVDSSRIFYFLGVITSHVSHALPLYERLGGTFVVTSERAKAELELLHLPVVCVDDVPYLWQRIGRRPQRNFQYTTVTRRLRKTCEYLDQNADIVLFYELFSIENTLLEAPKKVFLTHGNMLKNYMTMDPKRLESIKKYDYMAALSPYMKQKFIDAGIDPKKLVDIGVARTDQIITDQKNKAELRKTFETKLSIPRKKPIVLYAPTFWGETSVFDTGIEIANNISNVYSLLIRLHPQTPEKVVRKYRSIAKRRANVWLTDDAFLPEFSFSKQLACADLLIADVSSIVLEALLTNIPIVFAAHRQVADTNQEYESIREVVRSSETVYLASTRTVNQIILSGLEKPVDRSLRSRIKSQIWFHPNDSVDAIIHFITTLE